MRCTLSTLLRWRARKSTLYSFVASFSEIETKCSIFQWKSALINFFAEVCSGKRKFHWRNQFFFTFSLSISVYDPVIIYQCPEVFLWCSRHLNLNYASVQSRCCLAQTGDQLATAIRIIHFARLFVAVLHMQRKIQIQTFNRKCFIRIYIC